MSSEELMLSLFPNEAAQIVKENLKVIEATVILPCRKKVENCLLIVLNQGKANELGLVYEKDTKYSYRLAGPVRYY